MATATLGYRPNTAGTTHDSEKYPVDLEPPSPNYEEKILVLAGEEDSEVEWLRRRQAARTAEAKRRQETLEGTADDDDEDDEEDDDEDDDEEDMDGEPYYDNMDDNNFFLPSTFSPFVGMATPPAAAAATTTPTMTSTSSANTAATTAASTTTTTNASSSLPGAASAAGSKHGHNASVPTFVDESERQRHLEKEIDRLSVQSDRRSSITSERNFTVTGPAQRLADREATMMKLRGSILKTSANKAYGSTFRDLKVPIASYTEIIPKPLKTGQSTFEVIGWPGIAPKGATEAQLSTTVRSSMAPPSRSQRLPHHLQNLPEKQQPYYSVQEHENERQVFPQKGSTSSGDFSRPVHLRTTSGAKMIDIPHSPKNKPNTTQGSQQQPDQLPPWQQQQQQQHSQPGTALSATPEQPNGKARNGHDEKPIMHRQRPSISEDPQAAEYYSSAAATAATATAAAAAAAPSVRPGMPKSPRPSTNRLFDPSQISKTSNQLKTPAATVAAAAAATDPTRGRAGSNGSVVSSINPEASAAAAAAQSREQNTYDNSISGRTNPERGNPGMAHQTSVSSRSDASSTNDAQKAAVGLSRVGSIKVGYRPSKGKLSSAAIARSRASIELPHADVYPPPPVPIKDPSGGDSLAQQQQHYYQQQQQQDPARINNMYSSNMSRGKDPITRPLESTPENTATGQPRSSFQQDGRIYGTHNRNMSNSSTMNDPRYPNSPVSRLQTASTSQGGIDNSLNGNLAPGSDRLQFHRSTSPGPFAGTILDPGSDGQLSPVQQQAQQGFQNRVQFVNSNSRTPSATAVPQQQQQQQQQQDQYSLQSGRSSDPQMHSGSGPPPVTAMEALQNTPGVSSRTSIDQRYDSRYGMPSDMSGSQQYIPNLGPEGSNSMLQSGVTEEVVVDTPPLFARYKPNLSFNWTPQRGLRGANGFFFFSKHPAAKILSENYGSWVKQPLPKPISNAFSPLEDWFIAFEKTPSAPTLVSAADHSLIGQSNLAWAFRRRAEPKLFKREWQASREGIENINEVLTRKLITAEAIKKSTVMIGPGGAYFVSVTSDNKTTLAWGRLPESLQACITDQMKLLGDRGAPALIAFGAYRGAKKANWIYVAQDGTIRWNLNDKYKILDQILVQRMKRGSKLVDVALSLYDEDHYFLQWSDGTAHLSAPFTLHEFLNLNQYLLEVQSYNKDRGISTTIPPPGPMASSNGAGGASSSADAQEAGADEMIHLKKIHINLKTDVATKDPMIIALPNVNPIPSKQRPNAKTYFHKRGRKRDSLNPGGPGSGGGAVAGGMGGGGGGDRMSGLREVSSSVGRRLKTSVNRESFQGAMASSGNKIRSGLERLRNLRSSTSST